MNVWFVGKQILSFLCHGDLEVGVINWQNIRLNLNLAFSYSFFSFSRFDEKKKNSMSLCFWQQEKNMTHFDHQSLTMLLAPASQTIPYRRIIVSMSKKNRPKNRIECVFLKFEVLNSHNFEWHREQCKNGISCFLCSHYILP